MRALESKALKGTRDNRNRWKIAPHDLDMWAKDRPGHDRTYPDTDRDTVRPDDHMKTLADLAAANARVEELRTAIDRADAHHNAEIKRLEHVIEQLMKPRPSLLERISGAFQKSSSGA